MRQMRKKLSTLLFLTLLIISLTGILPLNPRMLPLGAAIALSHSSSIWPTIADHFSLPSNTHHPNVRRQIDSFARVPSNFDEFTHNARPYLYYVYIETQKRHLPAELALLPMLESDYKPLTHSRAGAVGLWQLMPDTARGAGIKMNSWYDGRRDTIAATKVALNYLSYLHNLFNGNWLLAIAAYDAGSGTVLNAIHHNKSRGLPTDFWSLPLPKETKLYVPRLLAIAHVVSHPNDYHVQLPAISNDPVVDTVTIENPMNLTDIANKAGISLDEVRQLNPGFKRSTTPPHQATTLILPANHIDTFLHQSKTRSTQKTALPKRKKLIIRKKHHHSAQPRYHTYTVQPNDDIGIIAHRHHLSVSALKKLNHLASNRIIIGQRLSVL